MKNKITLCLSILIITSFATWGMTVEELPNQVIIIGSHILNINGVSSEHIDVAIKSIEYEKDGEYLIQDKTYYKSEFSDGTWYEITDSKSIDDVVGSGENIVTEDFIKGIYISHYTDEKGQTIDWQTGNKTSLHNIDSYRNPRNIKPEIVPLVSQEKTSKENLDSLKKQLSKTKDDDKEDELKVKIKKSELEFMVINEVLEIINMKELDQLDEIMDKYEIYISYLKNDLKVNEEKLELIQGQKASYRSKFQKNAVEKVIGRINEKVKLLDPNDSKDITNLLYDISNKLNSKLIEIEKAIDDSEATDTLGKIRKENFQKIYYLVGANKYKDTIESLNEIVHINNILDGKIKDAHNEIGVIDKAMGRVIKDFKTKISVSDTDMYKKLKASGESLFVLQSIEDGEVKLLKNLKDEIVFLKNGKLERLGENLDKKEYLQGLKDEFEKIKAGMKTNDDFYDQYLKLVQELIDDLTKSLALISAEDDLRVSELKNDKTNMKNELSELNESYLKAIENGNMDLSESIKDAMAKIADELEDSEKGALLEFGELLNKKNNSGLSPEEEGRMLGLKEELAYLDKNLIDNYENAFEDLYNSIEENNIVNLDSKYELFNSLSDKLSDKLKKAYLDSNKQEILDLLNSVYKNMLEKEMYSEAKVIMEIINPDYVDTIDKEVVDSYGLNKAKDLFDKSYILSQLIREREDYSDELSQINTKIVLAQDSFGDKNKLYDEYLDTLNKYTYIHKEILIIKILILEALDDDSSVVANYQGDLIRNLKEFDNKKYSKEDIIKIKNIELTVDDSYKYISAEDFIMTEFNVPIHYPILIKNKDYFMPVRTLYETFGGIVQWDGETMEISITNKNDTLKFDVDSNIVYVNNQPQKMSSDVILDKDKSYIPIDFVKDYYGMNLYGKNGISILYGENVDVLVKKILAGE